MILMMMKKVTRERDEARSEANESQQSANNLFNEQKRLESQNDRMRDDVACTSQAANKRVVAKECELTELHESSTVRTTVYGSNTVQVYVQSIS